MNSYRVCVIKLLLFSSIAAACSAFHQKETTSNLEAVISGAFSAIETCDPVAFVEDWEDEVEFDPGFMYLYSKKEIVRGTEKYTLLRSTLCDTSFLKKRGMSYFSAHDLLSFRLIKKIKSMDGDSQVVTVYLEHPNRNPYPGNCEFALFLKSKDGLNFKIIGFGYQ